MGRINKSRNHEQKKVHFWPFAGRLGEAVNLKSIRKLHELSLSHQTDGEAAGLRTQILFWSFHGRAEMRSRMPRPARIVEYGARESDKIGIASSNDRLSLS